MTGAEMGAVRGEYGGGGPFVRHDTAGYHKAEDKLSLEDGHDTEAHMAEEDRLSFEIGLDEVAGLGSTGEAFAMAVVINDLGCTLQQVGEPSKYRLQMKTWATHAWCDITKPNDSKPNYLKQERYSKSPYEGFSFCFL